MFGANEIVGKKHFADMPTNHLKVVSIFATLQGEGPYRGERCVFVRLAKCNLACSFCDTYFDSGTDMSYGAILNQAEAEVAKVSQKHLRPLADWGLVITGGEPMLQDNLGGFLDRVQRKFKWTQIESNGIPYQELPPETTLVISPKCFERNGKPQHYLKPHKKNLERANCLKFVMEADPRRTSPEQMVQASGASPYSMVPEWALEWKEYTGDPVFVSPMNIYNNPPTRTADMTVEARSEVDEVVSWWTPNLLDLEANQRNHEWAARYALRHGLIFQMQLHLFAGLA